MSYDPLQRQNWIWKILRAHIRHQRLAHAYLFTGSSHADKAALARHLVQKLNCSEGAEEGWCQCVSCTKINAEMHPDVFTLGADLKVKSIKLEEVQQKNGCC